MRSNLFEHIITGNLCATKRGDQCVKASLFCHFGKFLSYVPMNTANSKSDSSSGATFGSVIFCRPF